MLACGRCWWVVAQPGRRPAAVRVGTGAPAWGALGRRPWPPPWPARRGARWVDAGPPLPGVVLRNYSITPTRAPADIRDASHPAPIWRAPRGARRSDGALVVLQMARLVQRKFPAEKEVLRFDGSLTSERQHSEAGQVGK